MGSDNGGWYLSVIEMGQLRFAVRGCAGPLFCCGRYSQWFGAAVVRHWEVGLAVLVVVVRSPPSVA